jgi:hypothetical protein
VKWESERESGGGGMRERQGREKWERERVGG